MRSQPGCAGKNQGKLQHSANAGDPYRSECTGEIVKTCTDGRGISTLPLIDGVETVRLWNWRNGRCQPIKCSHFMFEGASDAPR